MSNKLTKQDVQNMLDNVSIVAPELKQYKIVNADARCGKRIALAKDTDNILDVKTDYMLYSEMIQFLRGYSFKCENKLSVIDMFNINYKIKVGDVYLCLKDYIMDDGSIEYTKGKKYLSESKGCITDNGMDTRHSMKEQNDFFEYFKLVE